MWSEFSLQFSNKNISQLKNKFFNQLRKIARRITDFQKNFTKKIKNFVTY